MNDRQIHPYNYPEKIISNLRSLKELDLSAENFDSISYKIDKNIGLIPSEGICLKKGTEVFRARKHPIIGGDMFQNLKELSIRESKFITTYGRANIPKQAVFYCSLNPLTAAREVTQWQLDDLGALINKGINLGSYNPFAQFITISTWVLNRDLYFISTFKDKEVFGEDVNADQIFNHLNKRYHIERKKFDESKNIVLDFFSSEFSKSEINNQYDYYYSAYYSNLVYTKSKVDFISGLIYLSIADDLEGYNIAIPEHYLQNLSFVSADFCYAYNSKNKVGFENQKISIGPSFRASLGMNDSLVWTDIVTKNKI